MPLNIPNLMREKNWGFLSGHNFLVLHPTNLIFAPNNSFSHTLFLKHKNRPQMHDWEVIDSCIKNFKVCLIGCVLTIQVGQEIEVRPGIVSKTSDGKIQCTPIRSRIVSLFAEHNELQYAVPGGLIG